MLRLALVSLLVALVAALLGFTTVAGAAFAIARFLAFLFLALFVILLALGITAARRLTRAR